MRTPFSFLNLHYVIITTIFSGLNTWATPTDLCLFDSGSLFEFCLKVILLQINARVAYFRSSL